MTKRVSNSRGPNKNIPLSKRPARSRKTHERFLAKKRWAARQEKILNRRADMVDDLKRRFGNG